MVLGEFVCLTPREQNRITTLISPFKYTERGIAILEGVKSQQFEFQWKASGRCPFKMHRSRKIRQKKIISQRTEREIRCFAFENRRKLQKKL